MTFFTILSTYAIFKASETSKNKFYWITYIISSVLGFYTMVIYLYPFISLHVFFIINNRKKKLSDWKIFMKVNLLVFTLVMMLYTPVFLVSGIHALTSNSWIIKMPLTEYMNYFPVLIGKQFSYITGLEVFYFFISPVILISVVIVLFLKKEYKWMILILSSFLVPLIIVSIQRIQIYERIWTYLIFYQSLAAGIIFFYAINRIASDKSRQLTIAAMVSVIFILFTLNTYHKAVAEGHGVYDQVKPIADYIYGRKATKIYVTEMTYNHYIRYKYHVEKKEIQVDELAKDLDRRYDFIIIDNKRHSDSKVDSLKFVKVYSNEYADVYELIK